MERSVRGRDDRSTEPRKQLEPGARMPSGLPVSARWFPS